MIIKKYEAQTEKEAIILAKQELGKDAIVMNIKTVKPRGIYRFFHKPTVEVTAAVDEIGKQTVEKKENNLLTKGFSSRTEREDKVQAEKLEPGESAIEKRLNSLQDLLEKQLANNNTEPEEKQEELSQNEEYLLHAWPSLRPAYNPHKLSYLVYQRHEAEPFRLKSKLDKNLYILVRSKDNLYNPYRRHDYTWMRKSIYSCLYFRRLLSERRHRKNLVIRSKV